MLDPLSVAIILGAFITDAAPWFLPVMGLVVLAVVVSALRMAWRNE